MNIVLRMVVVVATVVSVVGVFASPARAEFALKDSDRVVLFGDASLGQPYFSEWLDQFVRSKYPELSVEIVCFSAQQSDAADGNRRLPIEVLPMKPTWVILSFGLDAPQRKAFSQPLLDAYVEDMGKMIDTVRQTGAKVLVFTPPPPDEARNKGLQRAKFDQVLDKYAEALRKLAAERQIEVLDWHAALKERIPRITSAPNRHWTKQGLMPYGVSVAVATDLLLDHWGAEPIDYMITADWTGSKEIAVTMGTARVAEQTGEQMVVELTGAPVALDQSLRGTIPYKEWPMMKWCKYKLKIENLPSGGVVISDSGKAAKPFLAQQLAVGADMSGVGPMVDNMTTQKLRNAIRTKLNQFRKFRDFCHRKAPEPELKEGYRLYLEAERALAQGAHQIVYRTPSRFNAKLTIELAQKATGKKGTGKKRSTTSGGSKKN